MSRHNPYEPPWLRPEAVRLWHQFREDHARDWRLDTDPIQDRVASPEGGSHNGKYTPEPLHFYSKEFALYRRYPKLLDWRTRSHPERDHGSKVEAVSWPKGDLNVLVWREYVEQTDYSTYGKFTDDPDTEIYGKTWGTMLYAEGVWKRELRKSLKKVFGAVPQEAVNNVWTLLRKELHPEVGSEGPKGLTLRTLKGPSSRHAWRVGVYDTFKGRDDHHDRNRRYRYIQLDGYNYDELREMYWLAGRSKREADELARQEFRSRVAVMKRIAKGDLSETRVAARIYHKDDDDERYCLGRADVYGVFDTRFVSEKRHLDQVARDAASEALDDWRVRTNKDTRTGVLPGVT